MTEITLARYHDILHKFFIVIGCLGLFILAMDLIALANHTPLYLVGQPVTGGWIGLIFILDGIMITLSAKMVIYHGKLGKEAKWR